jgi:hypothetical protein
MKQVTAMPILSAGSPIPAFRCIVLLSACLVVFGSGCSVQQAKDEEANEPAAGQTAASADLSADQLTPADIRLAGVRLGSSDGGGAFQVAGRIQNNSPTFTLTQLGLKVVLQDCLDTGVCEILAEDVANVTTEVPAGEARDFQADAHFAEMRPPQGRLGWHYVVVDAKGAKP